MYSAYFDMIETVYRNYYDENGNLKIQDITRDKIYYYLTSEPFQQGNQYFDSIPPSLMQSFLKISEEKLINWNSQSYYHVYPGNEPPKGPAVTVRVVANISSQTEAIKAACQLWEYCQNQKERREPHPVACTINQYKILLGNNCNRQPVKMDKIVIYNKIPIPSNKRLSINLLLKEQMRFLSAFCPPQAPLPQFVWKPHSYSSVGYGEGIPYHYQDMTFSEPRADCLFTIIKNNRNRALSLDTFQKLLSQEFTKIGISGNIPFINKCKTQADETKWLI